MPVLLSQAFFILGWAGPYSKINTRLVDRIRELYQSLEYQGSAVGQSLPAQICTNSEVKTSHKSEQGWQTGNSNSVQAMWTREYGIRVSRSRTNGDMKEMRSESAGKEAVRRGSGVRQGRQGTRIRTGAPGSQYRALHARKEVAAEKPPLVIRFLFFSCF